MNALLTYLYAYMFYKTQFFKNVSYQYQMWVFLLNTLFVSCCVTSLNIFMEQYIFHREGYGHTSWAALVMDFLVLGFNTGRFTLICLLGHHTFFLGRQVLEDKEEENNLKIKKLSLQQEALKLKIEPEFLKNTFDVLENIATKDKIEARKLVSLFSDVLRNALSYDKTALMPLSNELKAMQQYIDLTSYTWAKPLQLAYATELVQKGQTLFLPAGTLLTLANFLLYKTHQQWHIDLQTTNEDKIILSLYFQPLYSHIAEDFASEASIENLQQRLQNYSGKDATLQHVQTSENSCLRITLKGSSTP